MATIRFFEDLVVWQKARILCDYVFELIQKPGFATDYKLKDQINGSSGSVMDNIAEGFGRKGNNEFINFLTISNGSLMEVRSQLYRAFDRHYIKKEKLEELLTFTASLSSMIHGLIEHLAKSTYRGQKYKIREKIN